MIELAVHGIVRCIRGGARTERHSVCLEPLGDGAEYLLDAFAG